ncbi:Glycosyltransferase involved in cell wall bisynthesis [Halomonas shengliensis]|uniref:Glycosyltransferase involved in cell wall bisynthesis n=1 Tax=Halomonas shengliensis TaxID=419597 RepID=A0A1H0L4J8_9GAMM|nr:glycosyltransferase [Halomonas shengliensis]SDO63204.1 Glycosyltransferase involved in cell wall bisynthesis [Halomonas shengliensis]
MNLHIVRNSVSHDSRVLKETESILESELFNRLEISGLKEDGFPVNEKIDDGRTIWRASLRTRKFPKDLVSQFIKYAEWYRLLVRRYRNSGLNVIHCHDLTPLPIAVRLKQITGARLIYDAHELETETAGARGARQSLAKSLEKRLIPKVDAMITVSPSIQKWYGERYPEIPVHLIRNIPAPVEESIDAVPLREILGIPDHALLFIYLGGLSKGRGIEIALEAFQQEGVPHHIVFMGNGPLENTVRNAAQNDFRIHYKDPVPPKDVVSHASGADVGICLYEDTCLNHRYCLPNKLFESLLAGLPVLASPLPDQAEVVKKHQAGWVVENDVESVSNFLRKLTLQDGVSLREGLLERVEGLTWRNEGKKLSELYHFLVQLNEGNR